MGLPRRPQLDNTVLIGTIVDGMLIFAVRRQAACRPVFGGV